MFMDEIWQPPQADYFAKVRSAYLEDDDALLDTVLPAAGLSKVEYAKATDWGRQWLQQLRGAEQESTAFDALMQQYSLSKSEGVLMMCLAEALLRIPDQATVDLLLSDKLSPAQWQKYLGKSNTRSVNLATWGLLLGRKVMGKPKHNPSKIGEMTQAVVKRLGAPVVRRVVMSLMQQLGQQFILGHDIKTALQTAEKLLNKKKEQFFSFDMLGEAARNMQDAERYFEAYKQSLLMLAQYDKQHTKPSVACRTSISIKLSALYPRYEVAQRTLAIAHLQEKLRELARIAAKANLEITIDAEECARLELSLEVFYNIFSDPEFAGWHGLGLALQCYQKRALPLLQWLIAIAKQHKKKIPVRLVKGAYWDSEIKRAQQLGLQAYPVFTRKQVVDSVYLACARLMLGAPEQIISQFATHHVLTAAAVLAMAGEAEVEFQHLHGMGASLHQQLMQVDDQRIRNRVYAPVGIYHDLLPYLVRRLLENGANNSFVQQMHQGLSDQQLLANPFQILKQFKSLRNPSIPLPENLYAPARLNSPGMDLTDVTLLKSLYAQWSAGNNAKPWCFARMLKKHALVSGQYQFTEQVSYNPAAHAEIVGTLLQSSTEKLTAVMQSLALGHGAWSKRKISERADCLRRLADLLIVHRYEIMYLIVREAGRTIEDSLSELREAIDFCRYYAALAEDNLQEKTLPGPTGEDNVLSMHGRGVFACISPWNFPVAIFTGQIAAALVTGNAVLAKPSSDTPLCAARIVELAYYAGIPSEVLQLAVCRADALRQYVFPHPALAGVMLTGSNATATAIATELHKRSDGLMLPLIAETGGINAMLVDSSAFVEQVVDDVIASAFGSAGQRCSSLRVLCLQDEIADQVIDMLCGAMQMLQQGDPSQLQTDIGPLISTKAADDIQAYISQLQAQIEGPRPEVQQLYAGKINPQHQRGSFIAPHIFEVDSLQKISREVFGPVLHIYRYQRQSLDQVIQEVNSWGYGLTCGIHSRIDYQVEYIAARIRAGNIYVNRNMIGAVVGSQPFGGQGMSGTGPKAGGPHYLYRLCHEKLRCINTAAVGGNAELLTQADDSQLELSTAPDKATAAILTAEDR